jgi:hypothetical protein
MPIQIVTAPEPLSPASYDPNVDCVLIDSDVSKALMEEMRRYCNRQVTGRSFLIAGHRGSGKTTLVGNAFLQVMKESHKNPAAFKLRPLWIPLHGSNLLPDSQPKQTNPDTNQAEQEDADSGEDRPLGELQIALIQIILGLYRHLAKEMTRSYRERIAERGSIRGASRSELLELTAGLEIELDEHPGPARLRDLWGKGGFLRSGVLFADASRQLDSDQGFRELVALYTASRAYQRISGSFTGKEERKMTATRSEETSTSSETTGKDLFQPIVSLLTGGLAGTGVFAGLRETGGSAGIWAGLAGLVAALGTATVFKYSAMRSREQSVHLETTFLPDLSDATLDRVLPILIDRLFDAGLAPIFVVDELDKVGNLSDRITNIVRRLKQLVAERAFFCFLTDRSYFERMRRREVTTTYPIEYTYFTYKLFVTFRPEDFHDYLGRILKEPEPPPWDKRTGQGMDIELEVEAEDKSESILAELTETSEISDEIADYPLLPYILLHQSQMHPIDLRRQLSAIRSEEGTVSLRPGLVRTASGYRFDLMIQLAIEMLLDRDDMRAILDREGEFRRLAYDALYYPSRMWDRGILDLSNNYKRAFTSYLLARMKTDPEKLVTLPKNSEEKSAKTDPEKAVTLPKNSEEKSAPNDGHQSIFDKVTELIDLLEPDAAKNRKIIFELVRELEPLITFTDSLRDADRRFLHESICEFTTSLEKSKLSDKDKLFLKTQVDEMKRLLSDADTLPDGDRDYLFEQVRELAYLLSESEEYYKRILEWEQARGKREEKPISPEILDALPIDPPLAPLLKRVRKHVYKWRFDRSGRPLEKLAKIERWQPAADFLTQIASDLKSLGGDSLNLQSMANELNLIRTTPAWSEVKRGINRLRQAEKDKRRHEKYLTDASHVTEFARMIEEYAEIITLAMICGRVLARARIDDKLLEGIIAVTESYGFGRLDLANKLEILRALKHSITIRFSSVDSNLLTLPKLERPSTVEWCDAVKNAFEEIKEKVQLEEPELEKAVENAWNSWRSRLDGLISSGRQEFGRPELDDLLCFAANRSPSRLLDFDPNSMTVIAWSRVLYWALADVRDDDPMQCPPWMIVPALRALGFGQQVADIKRLELNTKSTGAGIEPRYRHRKLRNDHIDQLQSWLSRLAKVPKRRAAFIVKQAGASITDTWHPSGMHAAIALGAKQLNSLLDLSPIDSVVLFKILGIETLFIEKPDDQKLTDGIIKRFTRSKLMQQEQPYTKIKLIYPEEPDVKTKYPSIIAPVDVDDLFEPEPTAAS